MKNKNNAENRDFSMEWEGKTLTVSFNNLAEKANGEAMVRYGDTIVYAVVTMSDGDIDKGFFPLSVSYEEKFYAAGKISGSRYTRREGKPSDKATLVSRMIDRAIRPRFPENLKREVQVIITCLSWDEENDPAVLGMIASSIALHTSDIPWNGPLGSVRFGKNDNIVANPDYEKRLDGSSDIVISGFTDEDNDLIVNMIEGVFKEEKEDVIYDIFEKSQSHIKELCGFQGKIRENIGKEKAVIENAAFNKEVIKTTKEKVDKRLDEIFSSSKNREADIKELKNDTHIYIEESYTEEEDIKIARDTLDKTIKEKIRENILEKDSRVDFRDIDELRKISCSVSLLPRTHGSGLFQRGQTKSLSIVTLGAPGEEQLTDAMELAEKKRFMHHYNFPPSSVGEVGPIRGPGRREIGHGMLAENAILPLLPNTEKFPYIIRSVSEIVCSNGSTSMASVCGTTLALMDAGVPITRPAAGISIGLVAKDKKNYKLLTDIQGMEDHCGDMDFKVAGTEKGVTVIQMDVKIAGITLKMIKEALDKAQKTRLQIIEEIKKVIPEPKKEISPYAPKIETISINPEKIGDVIGPKGKTINEIIDQTGVEINIDDSGLISLASTDKEKIEKAIKMIENITREATAGDIFEGKVIKILSFGAVIEIFPGKEGLLHISEIANRRIEKVEDVLSLGQAVRVKVIKVEDNGKTSLSMKKVEK